MRVQYLAIEGVIGAGKSSLATRMAERYGARLLLEQHEENPFLQDFYRDPARFAFSTQMFFLLSRYRQQQELPQRDLFHDLLVADYLFAKDRIFATLTLEERELGLYDKVARLLERDILKPDLVVYLQMSTERLMKNIRLRDRSYERNMSADYIRDLNEAYNRFFFNYTETPLLVINATAIDFVHKEKDFEDLIVQLNRPISGVQYYSPPQ
ncbi:MAG: deoxynucleoside kinase [bacterium]